MKTMDGLNGLSQTGQDQRAESARHEPPTDGSGAAPSPEPAFDILQPEGCEPGRPASPLVFASPHSGRHYPEDLLAQSALDGAAIRRSEDAYVDRLIAGGPAFGAVNIQARYARAYIDVNREAYELDPAMFVDELPAFARARSARVAAGLGSIARVVAEGQEIYRGKLTFEQARGRIDALHHPYHRALQRLLEEARDVHGAAILIDWHSMPSGAAGAGPHGRKTCDMVLGDRFGSACASGLTRLVDGALEGMGFRVARNAPYAGGYTTESYGRPEHGVHALQIEINRALYLDEATLRPHAGFERLRRDLDRLFKTLARDWRRAL
jgi:N-formylglutamate amidohydrolase